MAPSPPRVRLGRRTVPEAATPKDVTFAILIPLLGVVLGLVHLARGQRKRGATVLAIGVAANLLVLLMLKPW